MGTNFKYQWIQYKWCFSYSFLFHFIQKFLMQFFSLLFLTFLVCCMCSQEGRKPLQRLKVIEVFPLEADMHPLLHSATGPEEMEGV